MKTVLKETATKPLSVAAKIIVRTPMKHLPFILLLLLFLPSYQAQEPQTLPPIEVWFSPKGGCTEAVVKEIDAAKKTLLVSQVSRSR